MIIMVKMMLMVMVLMMVIACDNDYGDIMVINHADGSDGNCW